MEDRPHRFASRHAGEVTESKAQAAVIAAFQEAKSAGFEVADCYRLATDAWCALYPDHRRAQAARRAVAILQESFGTLQDMARD